MTPILEQALNITRRLDQQGLKMASIAPKCENIYMSLLHTNPARDSAGAILNF
jgi:hypothetical protein